ncbi:MAG: hypothetical protein AMJ43_09710 [Coxiella sp. DG_40]|nr:MAG: hypothetical protein AMJ43_09710 [Coxiella sp. DG_40]
MKAKKYWIWIVALIVICSVVILTFSVKTVEDSRKDEIRSINQCRRSLLIMLNDRRMVLTEDEKVTVNQVIKYIDLYENVIRESHQNK